jgi:hypothetical protein
LDPALGAVLRRYLPTLVTGQPVPSAAIWNELYSATTPAVPDPAPGAGGGAGARGAS